MVWETRPLQSCISNLIVLGRSSPGALTRRWAINSLGELAIGGPFLVDEPAYQFLTEVLSNGDSILCRCSAANALAKMVWRFDGGQSPIDLNFELARQFVNRICDLLDTESDTSLMLDCIEVLGRHGHADYPRVEIVLKRLSESSHNAIAMTARESLEGLDDY